MSESEAPSSDEVKKKKTADKVVTKKALYFVPEHSMSVEADTPDEAAEIARKLTEAQEEGND